MPPFHCHIEEPSLFLRVLLHCQCVEAPASGHRITLAKPLHPALTESVCSKLDRIPHLGRTSWMCECSSTRQLRSGTTLTSMHEVHKLVNLVILEGHDGWLRSS